MGRYYYPRSLSLDGSDCDTLCKIFLDERIYDQQRSGGYNNDTIFQLFGELLFGDHGISRRAHLVGLIHQDQIAQHNLQRHLVIILQIHQCIEELVPHRRGIEQAHNSDDGGRKRDCNLKEKGKVRAAVNL